MRALLGKRDVSGSAAVAAVAVIVVVGMLCGALATMVRTGSSDVAKNIKHTQAYYIADAGVEWACRQNSATSGAVSFGGGAFQVTANSGAWLAVGTNNDAKRIILCQPQAADSPVTAGFDYVPDSRPTGYEEVSFLIMNTTSSAITFNKVTVSWTPAVNAWFDPMDVNVMQYQDYSAVYTADSHRWGNGETNTLDTAVTVPAHRTIEMKLHRFTNKSGANGSKVNMDAREFTVTLYSGNTQVGQVTIGVPLR